MQKENEFFDCFAKELKFWQVFPSFFFWSFFICYHKVCEFLRTLIDILKEFLKQCDQEPPMLKTFIHLDALDYVKYANVYMEEIGT